MDILNNIDPKKGGVICSGIVFGFHGFSCISFLINGGADALAFYLFKQFWAMPFIEVILSLGMIILFTKIDNESSKNMKLALFMMAAAAWGLQFVSDIAVIIWVVDLSMKDPTAGWIVVIVITVLINVGLTIVLLLNLKFADMVRKKE